METLISSIDCFSMSSTPQMISDSELLLKIEISSSKMI
jgi:hypothetical protein